MAAKPKKKKISGKYVFLHKLAAGISLLSLFVIVAAGVMSQASVYSMAFRSLGVIMVVSVIHRILVQILSTYEEMNSG